MVNKLSVEQHEALQDLFQHEGFRLFIRELEALVELQEKDVLRLTIDVGDERKLVYTKLQAEGARKLLINLIRHVEKFRLASSQASGSSR